MVELIQVSIADKIDETCMHWIIFERFIEAEVAAEVAFDMLMAEKSLVGRDKTAAAAGAVLLIQCHPLLLTPRRSPRSSQSLLSRWRR